MDMDRDLIVAEARALFRKEFPEIKEQAGCLYLSMCVIRVAHKYGIRLALQAGTCSWRRVPEELDDGVMGTHFSYVWEPDSMATRIAILENRLPELHVWAGDPATQELIDLTSGSFPAQCKELAGEEWLTPTPPDYIWMHSSKVPAYYRPFMDATILAGNLYLHHVRIRAEKLGLDRNHLHIL